MKVTTIAGVFAAALLLAGPAAAKMTSCELDYELEGWSFVFKKYEGKGTVRCENGQKVGVAIILRGGGFTLGKSRIDAGSGTFSSVRDIKEIFGTYVSAEAHAGATRGAEGRLMTKGQVSLATTGKGRGFDVGVALGGFTIKPR